MVTLYPPGGYSVTSHQCAVVRLENIMLKHFPKNLKKVQKAAFENFKIGQDIRLKNQSLVKFWPKF